LKWLIKRQGLLDKQPAYYTYKILLTSGMLALSLALVLLTDSLWLQLLNAAYLAFIFTQIAFIGHDLGHRQIFHSDRKSALLGLVVGNLILGLSRGWWVDKHNRHHASPNHDELDPDIDFPILAFSEEQARSKRGFARFVVKYQAYLFFPLLMLEAFNMRIHSINFLIQKKGKYLLAEALLLTIHFALYLGLLFYLLGLWSAVLFVIIHQALFGVYLGSVFAPNHKGMPVLDKDTKMDFLRRQVLTSRNLKAHPLTDFLFGPLGCQIEHHLFPTMPRNNQRKAEKIVKAFCREKSIAYHETSVLRSYREILQHLHQVTVPLRTDEMSEVK
jgi:fatty acid desaturase